MAGTYQSVRDSRLRNAVGTLAFVLAACWIALLFQRQKQDRERLERQRQRYRLALEGVSWAHGIGARLREISFLTAAGSVCWGCQRKPTTPTLSNSKR